jgi:hypothetical protein
VKVTFITDGLRLSGLLPIHFPHGRAGTPALVQSIMRHSKMDMTLYYSHSRRKAKRAAQERVLQHLIPEEMRVPMRVPESIH